MTLTGAQKKHLRGLAHSFKPIVQVGRDGLSENVLANLDEALESHELVKVKFSDDREERRRMMTEVDDQLGSVLVGAIGRVGIFFRQARDPEKRRVRVPAAKGS